MKAHTRVPRLNNPDIVIRTPHSDAEIRAANQLVFENYVNVGFWKDDARVIEENPWINSPHREIFVAACKHEIVGTFSIIHDSEQRVAVGLRATDVAASLQARQGTACGGLRVRDQGRPQRSKEPAPVHDGLLLAVRCILQLHRATGAGMRARARTVLRTRASLRNPRRHRCV